MTRPWILTCEHSVNRLPEPPVTGFDPPREALESHAGWDPGTGALCRQLNRLFALEAHQGVVTRLLVDLNRSADNPAVWSPWSRDLPPAVRAALIARYHRPYWCGVFRAIRARLEATRRVIHFGIHSFTPDFPGSDRDFEIGLLFDPERPFEVATAESLREALATAAPALRVRFNEPYRGTDDGLTTSLRKRFPESAYAGLEIECNQRFARDRGRDLDPDMANAIVAALRALPTSRPP